MATAELLVPEEAVAEYLGLRPDQTVEVAGPRLPVALNVAQVNWNGVKFLHGGDVVRVLRHFAERNSNPLLASVADQLAEACGLTGRG